jgi:hypothetical protein
MATTQITPNNYRLRNAIAFVNSFSSAYNSMAASFTGTVTNACNVISAISSNTGIGLGQVITSSTAGIPTASVVTGVTATTVTLSSLFTGSTTVGATVNTYNSTVSGYYMFAGQSGLWPNSTVPQYYDNPVTVDFTVYNNMLFGKSIQSSDVSLMADSIPWTSGSVYDMYDDIDTLLSTKQFYVYTTSGSFYYVFKCLYNNNGSVSSYAPVYSDTTAGDPYYETSDGYQWKYLYKISTANYSKFATNLYIPIIPDANVTKTAVSGAVDVIVPVDGNNNVTITTGSGYNNYYSGTLSSASVVNTTTPLVTLDTFASKINNYYSGCYFYINGGTGKGQYKKVTTHVSNTSGIFIYLDSQYATIPDNTSTYVIAPAVTILNSSDQTVNVAAIALVNSSAANSIYKIQVLSRGSNVYSAAAFVNVATQVGVSNVATIRVIASPKGGHGSNVAAELYCSTVGISTTFANSESNTIPIVNDYQTVGILANPLFANVVFTTTGQVGQFSVGETVTQTLGNVTSKGIVTVPSPLAITNATGSFVVSTNSSVGLVYGSSSAATAQVTQININNVVKGFRTFNQLYTYNGTYGGAAFTQNETVYQVNSAISNAVFHSNNAAGTTVYLTQKKGPIYSSNTLTNAGGSTFTINTKYAPDLVPESGDIIYIENFDSVNRLASQSETIKLILQY